MPDVTRKDIDNIQEGIKEVGTHLDDVRTKLDDTPTRGDLKDTEKRIMDDVVPLMCTRQEMESMLKSQDTLKTRMDTFIKGMADATGTTESELVADQRAAFTAYLKSGCDKSAPAVAAFRGKYQAKLAEHGATMTKQQRAGLSEAIGTEGGLLVPAPMRLEMQKLYTVMDPLGELARRVTLTAGNSYEIPKRTSDVASQGAAGKAAEQGKTTAAHPAFGMITRVVHPATVFTDSVSIDFLNDVQEAEQIITEWAGEALGYLRGSKFILGTDVGEPEGLTVNGDIERVDAADTSTHNITGDDFYKLLTTLKAFYRPGASFMFNSNSLYTVLTLKDSNNQYLLPFSLRDGVPSSIAGKPFHIAENMPDDGTDDYLAVAFGDFRRGYWVADRGGIEMWQDKMTDKPNVEYLWRIRYDGAVANAEAIKLLKM